ncbi:SDR family NAD(P)-dependent oxidoreductase [Leifsonia sp. AG29]|uniref:SDR family NAD(P)-dependent oxidoreductase n=1 Tax=Leifsonia sp. AG29 TaxID=2598860 RepID=UPI00131C9C67|nr:SDR family NAD(P)-dependent oxidoreductase [Leifsonia sp. AG29]
MTTTVEEASTESTGELRGRTALVTGATGHLGRSLVWRFAEEGARLVIADLDPKTTEELAAEVRSETGIDALAVTVDVSDAAAVDEVADRVTAEFGVCDTVLVNAGLLSHAHALGLSQAEWDRTIRVNLTGSFITAKAFAQRMVDGSVTGSITFTSSLFGVRGGAGNAAYSATKFGVIGLAQSLAGDLAPAGIRVNCVCPGQIESRMLDTLFEERAVERGTSAEAERGRFLERIPLGRLGTPDEVAQLFVFLASERSSYITGQQFVLDGGWQVG